MEPTTFNSFVYIITPILAAVLGGWIGAYLGSMSMTRTCPLSYFGSQFKSTTNPKR